VGTIITFLLCSLGILLTTLSADINSTFANMISDIGILVAIYYGATGIACAWAFRRVLLKSVLNLILIGILPLIGGVFLLWIGYQVIVQGVGAAIPVLITLGLGIPLTVVAALVNRNGFFTRRRSPTIRSGPLKRRGPWVAPGGGGGRDGVGASPTTRRGQGRRREPGSGRSPRCGRSGRWGDLDLGHGRLVSRMGPSLRE